MGGWADVDSSQFATLLIQLADLSLDQLETTAVMARMKHAALLTEKERRAVLVRNRLQQGIAVPHRRGRRSVSRGQSSEKDSPTQEQQ